jgi:hypothetical protein
VNARRRDSGRNQRRELAQMIARFDERGADVIRPRLDQ